MCLTLDDDLGHPAQLAHAPRRVVSLVPSLTEAIAISAPDALVGATDWCTEPVGLDVSRVRGTKNPDLDAIAGLAPDLVVASQEENRSLDVERLRDRGITVWVTKIDSLDEAFVSLRRLFLEVLGLGEAPYWLTQAKTEWGRPATDPSLRVAVPIWKDPWMWVGSDTYADDVLNRLGWLNVAREAGGRYPKATPAEIAELQPDVLLLPDEPYAFALADLPPELASVAAKRVAGRHLFWYGPAMAEARRALGSKPRSPCSSTRALVPDDDPPCSRITAM